MINSLFRRISFPLVTAALALGIAGCEDSVTLPIEPDSWTLEFTSSAATVEVGKSVTTALVAVGSGGSRTTVDSAVVYSGAPQGIVAIDAHGVVTALKSGSVTITATAASRSGVVIRNPSVTLALTVTDTSVVDPPVDPPAGDPPVIVINEVETNGDVTDWVELYNPNLTAVDLSGWVIKDDDNSHIYTIPSGTQIAAGGYFTATDVDFGFGLGAPDSVRVYAPGGVPVAAYGWTTHAPTTWGRCPNLTGPFVATTSSTKGAANDCSVAVVINEVESNGGVPGDWIELFNPGVMPVDLSGFVVKDNDDAHNHVLPAGTVIPAGGYYLVEEADLGFGLGAADAARLFDPEGALIDSYTWTAHAATTWGRCPNGTGEFATTVKDTKGAANSCGSNVGPTALAWPVNAEVVTVDPAGLFASNISGLTYEFGGAGSVLWAVRNGPGAIFRMVRNGTGWAPDPANGWGAGKALRYPGGTGDPDAEGITFASGGSAAGLYVSTERNNANNGVSRNAILRFDPTAAGPELIALNDWNLTPDLPVTGANLGIEAITWVPDSYLTANGFRDESKGHAYNPSEYANHGDGLFFVGVEDNGGIYAYALDHVNNSYTRIATIATSWTTGKGVMDLHFDRELKYLWAICDDGCGGQYATYEVDLDLNSATAGQFIRTNLFARPLSMPNLNNEGFTIAPLSECVGDTRPVFWGDDGSTNGHAIRQGMILCSRFGE
ncbi:MAG: lamin tail domain-containing protein [Gemmatimonadota bacterium]|jgi:hypothetical protein|nr:lamin tail domain-containing protein [Gemmatimonadota bacterium]